MARLPRPPKRQASRDGSLAATWVAALQAGASVEDVGRQIAGEPPERASAGLRALGAAGSPGGVVPLLLRVAEGASPELITAAVETLGEVRDQSAAEALSQIAEKAGDRSVQKAARRALHRLSSQGVRAEARSVEVPAIVGPKGATLYRAVASTFDGSGARALWLGAERPLGGIYFFALLLNDVKGLADCVVQDTTRKRMAEREAEYQGKDPMAWVELPLLYARQLVQEAVDTTRDAGLPVPQPYAVWADLIGSPAEPFAQALVYREISAVEVRLHPTLESETPRLFTQPEVEPWFFTPPEVRKWVQPLVDPGLSRLLVTPETDEQRLERLLREAVRELLTPVVLKGLRRRLEETAYIFVRTGREADARRAVAAAATIEEPRPLRPLHPFTRALMERSFRIAIEMVRAGAPAQRLARV